MRVEEEEEEEEEEEKGETRYLRISNKGPPSL